MNGSGSNQPTKTPVLEALERLAEAQQQLSDEVDELTLRLSDVISPAGDAPTSVSSPADDPGTSPLELRIGEAIDRARDASAKLATLRARVRA